MNADGKFIDTALPPEDAAKRERLENQLQESELRLRGILDRSIRGNAVI